MVYEVILAALISTQPMQYAHNADTNLSPIQETVKSGDKIPSVVTDCLGSLAEKEYESALEYYEKFLNDPHTEIRLLAIDGIAELYLKSNNYDEASLHYNEMIRVSEIANKRGKDKEKMKAYIEYAKIMLNYINLKKEDIERDQFLKYVKTESSKLSTLPDFLQKKINNLINK